MKKKSLLIVAILTFVLSFAFAACGGTETPHVHEYGAYTLVEGSMPTETEAGKATATCSCGETTTVDVPKLTDSTVWTLTTTDATCTADGKKEYTSVYGKVDVTIPAAHKLGTLVAATESTCNTQGNVAYYECEACGKYFAEDGTTELTAEQILKTLAEHAYGTLHEATEPTCFREGNVAYYECAVCKKYFDADHNEITSYVIEKTQHNFGAWQKGDENGHTRACQNEGCTETEVVPHDYEGGQCYPKNDDEHRLYCTVCNYEHLERHEFGEWEKKDETDHKQTCAKCNKVITEAHVGGTATCKEKAVCTVCHEPYGNFAEHVLGADGVCTVCGKTPNAVFGKTYSAFTVGRYGTVDTSVNALLTFDANGKAEGVTGSVSIIKKNGEGEEEDWYNETTEYYQITDSSVYIRYVDKENGTIEFVSSYYKATKSYAGGKYGTPTLTETKYPGYISATNGFIFIPQGYGSSIVLVPTDTAVTTDAIAASSFNNKNDLDGAFFVKYSGAETHTVYYNARNSFVAIDATITDFDGAEVAPAAIKTAKAMIVKDKSGNVIAKYGYNGTEVIALDEWAGKYQGDLGTVTVWGNGKITLPSDVEGVYTAVADKAYNIEVRVYNSDNDVVAYYEVTADNTAYTYTAEQPEATVTYDLGDYGTGSTDARFKGITYTLAAAPTPTSDDAVIFKGWVVGDDEETVYAAGAKIVLTGNTTVTAVWASKTKINIVNEKGENQTIYAGSEDILSEVLKAYIPTADGEEFNYWAIGGAAIDNEGIVGKTELTVTAVWKKKYTLTIVYGNGLANATEKYFENAATSPKEPPYTGGKNFDHWFTSDDNGATETARYTAGTAITADTTIYAAWIDANILYGKYLGFEVYGKSYDSPYLTDGKSAEIDVNGKATSGTRIVNNTVSDYSNGFFKFGNYYGYYDEVSKILVYNDYTGTGAQYDVHILFKGATSVVTEKAKYFILADDGTKKLIDVTVTVDGVESSFTIYFHDKKVEKVTWTADEGMTNVSDLFSVKTSSWSGGSIKTNVLKIYDLEGNLIGDFMKSGSQMVELDGSQGTYTLDGGEDLVLTGTGSATIGTDKGTVTKAADGSSYTYDLYITQGGVKVYYELTIDKTGMTYSLNKPMVTLSFDLDGKGTMAPVSVNKNIEYTFDKPTYDGYKFEGWYTGKTVAENGTVTYTGSVTKVTPTEDTTVYAKWAKAITVTFETEYGTAPENEMFKQGEYVSAYYFKTLADVEDYAFYGWYVKGDETKTVIKGSYQLKDENDVTFVALWKQKVTLTIVYKDAKATIDPVKVGPGKTIDFTEIKGKQYTENEQLYVVDKLYTDYAYTTEFTATSIDADTTLYASWKTAFIGIGTYKGANFDSTSGTDNASSMSSTLTVDADGNVSGRGTDVATKNGDIYKYSNRNIDFNNGVAYEDYQPDKTAPWTDINVYFIVKGSLTPKSAKACTWDSGKIKVLTCTYSDETTTLSAFYYNGRIYGGVTFVAKDAEGNAITDTDKIYTANTVYVLDAAGEWIAGFKKVDGAFAADETVKPE